MKITKDANKTTYSCLICGHEYIEYVDGTVEGEKFIEQENELTTYEPIIEKTRFGTREGAKEVKHKAYICPVCKKLQIEIK